jgi:hypothetical protein
VVFAFHCLVFRCDTLRARDASFGMRTNTISSFLKRRLAALGQAEERVCLSKGNGRVVCSLTGHSERLFVLEYSRCCCGRREESSKKGMVTP